MKRQTLCFLLGLLLIIPMSTYAYDFQSGDLYYNITSNEALYTVEVTYQEYRSTFNYTNLATLIIPETVTNDGQTYSVTSIGKNAFYFCSGLTSVTIPNSVTSIKDWAFYSCNGLTSVIIPNSITSIGKYAFFGCSSLTSVSIPNSITSIGYRAFYGAFAFCSGLTSVTIPESVTNIGDEAFYDVLNLIYNGSATGAPWGALSVNGYMEGNLIYESEAKISLLGCVRTTTGDITIPNSVTSIGRSAFFGCSGLTSVTIPNSVTSIGERAFSGCSGLTSVSIGNSVTSIGDEAFSGCSGLTSVTIPESVTSIGRSAFFGCSGLTSVTIPNSVTSIGERAFSGCSGLTSVSIGNSVTSIGDQAFSGCSGLTSVTIPESVTSIGNHAFFGCFGLTSVTIPNSVTSIGERAFSGCSGLISIISYAMTPPRCLYDVFRASEDVVVYVPCTALVDYEQAYGWDTFANIQCITSEEVETSDNSIIVTPSESEVTFTWPSNSNANAYTLEITKDGVVFCTLTFNANGQLMTIAFAPSKDRNNAHAPQAAQATVNGWQFTVTGLNEGSNYAYTMTVTDNSGTELQTYNGTFRTLGTTALDNINAADAAPVQKILRNGQVFILRGNEVYTVTGQKVAE